MQVKTIFCCVAIAASLSNCSGNDKKKNAQDPNTDYPSAYAGQTRIKKDSTAAAYKVEKLAEKIGRPWAIIAFPGNRLLVTDRRGFMQVLSAEGVMLKKITGFPEVWSKGQGGLLDVALDPDFAANNTIYWSFSQPFGKGNCTAVAKGQLNETDSVIHNPTVIFQALPELNSDLHFGSRLLFDKEGYLFVSAGERSNLEGRKQAQLLSSGLGKIFRITKEGKPAPGNPFINQKDAKPEIYSYGHRNPQGLDINPVTGDLWETEFGPRGGDEVNLIKPGKNYGWPVITYGIEYSGEKVGDGIQQKEGMEQPVYYWDPVLSPSGITFYNSDSIPQWKNNLFIGGLSSMHIARLIIENNKVVGEESLLSDKKERFRDITQFNGALYTVTDGGVLFRISKK
jgi:glucose/arabinose dehydrogenase